MYPREQYLKEIISKKDNGRIKIITGLRRSGKSVLLFQLYREWLLGEGVKEDQIIALALNILENARYRNPLELDKYVRDHMVDPKKRYYIFIDEIRVYPLSFAEFYNEYEGDKRGAWQDYYTYGGMPLATSLESHEVKSRYLKDLFDRTYIKDVLERHEIKNDTEVLDILLDVLASGIGSLTNPSKLANTFKSERQIGIGSETIEKYIGYFEESFLIEKAVRYDVKGRKYIGTPAKYYYTDLGLRNARLGFRQLEETHIMENVLYNDLIRRGMNVDVGVVEYNTKDADGKKIRKQLEVDFVVNQGGKRFYIQSALSIADPDKKEQEIESLKRIPDSFSKMVVVRDYLKPWQDENGITYVGIEQFLLNEELLK